MVTAFPNAVSFLEDRVAPAPEAVVGWWVCVVVGWGFPGVARGDSAFESFDFGEGPGGNCGGYEGAVRGVPGDVSVFRHGCAHAAVGFGVVMIPTEALQIRKCGPATGFPVDYVVDVALAGGVVAARESAGSIA